MVLDSANTFFSGEFKNKVLSSDILWINGNQTIRENRNNSHVVIINFDY